MSAAVDEEDVPSLSYEEERGKPMPSLQHGVTQMNLGFELKKTNEYQVVSELALEIGDRRYIPDLCVYPKRPINWDKDTITETTMPLATIEIMSPKQGSYELMEHVEAYLDAGVKSAWIVAPSFRSVYIYSKEQPLQSFTHGVVVDAVTGLRADLAEVFC